MTNAVARLEQIGTGKDLVEVAALLAASLAGPGREAPSAGEREGPAPGMEELRRAFGDWL